MSVTVVNDEIQLQHSCLSFVAQTILSLSDNDTCQLDVGGIFFFLPAT